MTKKILTTLGIVYIITGLAAPYQSHDILADFLYINPGMDLFREFLGFVMIAYALIPDVRINKVRIVLAAISLLLLATSVVGFWTTWLMVFDVYIFASAGIFLLLGSIELSTEPRKKVFRYQHASRTQKPKAARVRHAH